MIPRINVRNLPAPQRWGSAGLGMSWHHIIPFWLLRDVWNRLVNEHVTTQVPAARLAIRGYLLLCDRTMIDREALIDRMRADNTDQKRSGHHKLLPLHVHEANMLATAAVWPAWNVVGGPSARSDSPGDFDIDRFRTGLTPQEAVRMREVELLVGPLQLFAQGSTSVGPGTLGAITQLVARARPYLACDLPIPYRAGMWVKDPTTGLSRKRRDIERSATGQ
jgi:hypothetical protein